MPLLRNYKIVKQGLEKKITHCAAQNVHGITDVRIETAVGVGRLIEWIGFDYAKMK
jgi:hypothetical protein